MRRARHRVVVFAAALALGSATCGTASDTRAGETGAGHSTTAEAEAQEEPSALDEPDAGRSRLCGSNAAEPTGVTVSWEQGDSEEFEIIESVAGARYLAKSAVFRARVTALEPPGDGQLFRWETLGVDTPELAELHLGARTSIALQASIPATIDYRLNGNGQFVNFENSAAMRAEVTTGLDLVGAALGTETAEELRLLGAVDDGLLLGEFAPLLMFVHRVDGRTFTPGESDTIADMFNRDVAGSERPGSAEVVVDPELGPFGCIRGSIDARVDTEEVVRRLAESLGGNPSQYNPADYDYSSSTTVSIDPATSRAVRIEEASTARVGIINITETRSLVLLAVDVADRPELPSIDSALLAEADALSS